MGDVRAERAEDELAGLMGDRDVGEIYEKTEIVVGHPHLGAEFCRVWNRSHEGGFVGKTHPLKRTDAEIFVPVWKVRLCLSVPGFLFFHL